jgi:hypothetical protein
VIVREPIADGVQEHVATPLVAVTLSQPEITFVPSLKTTDPGVTETAVTETEVPYFAVVTDPGRDRAIVGVALLMVTLIV